MAAGSGEGAGPLVRRFDRRRIAARVRELGHEITLATGGRALLCLGVLPTSVIFLADLVRALPAAVTTDFVALRPVDPAAVPAPGSAAFSKDLETEIAGRHVLVVDTLVDTGRTLDFLLRALAPRAPASVRICALLDRPEVRQRDLPVAHAGFTIGRELVVGYGIDLDGWFASCPEILEVRDLDGVRADPAAALLFAQGLASPIEGPRDDA